MKLAERDETDARIEDFLDRASACLCCATQWVRSEDYPDCPHCGAENSQPYQRPAPPPLPAAIAALFEEDTMTRIIVRALARITQLERLREECPHYLDGVLAAAGVDACVIEYAAELAAAA